MNGWQKALIALACVVVIGTAGIFIAADRADRRTEKTEAKRLASETACRDKLREVRDGKASGDDVTVLTDCALNGFISQSDVVDALQAR
jgi:hypothetical protein